MSILKPQINFPWNQVQINSKLHKIKISPLYHKEKLVHCHMRSLGTPNKTIFIKSNKFQKKKISPNKIPVEICAAIKTLPHPKQFLRLITEINFPSMIGETDFLILSIKMP